MDDASKFMHAALELAEAAAAHGDVPVGAVVVVNGEIVGRGMNTRVRDASPLAHAELVAIEDAARTLGSWRLDDATLYVTLEPCPMCAGAIVQARVGTLVFGALDTKAGAVRSIYQVCDDPRLPHRVSVRPQVLADPCAEVLTRFFALRR